MTWYPDMLTQTAVYWGAPSNDGYGRYTFDDPVELTVRWSDVQKDFIDVTTGRQTVSESMVHLSQAVALRGWLYLGSLNDIASDDQDDPQKVAGAKEIKGISAVAGVDGTEFVYKAFL